MEGAKLSSDRLAVAHCFSSRRADWRGAWPRVWEGNPCRLAAQLERSEETLILLLIVLLRVVQELPALGDESEKTAAAGNVLAVRGQMLRQVVDTLRKAGNLDAGTSGIRFVDLEVRDVDG